MLTINFLFSSSSFLDGRFGVIHSDVDQNLFIQNLFKFCNIASLLTNFIAELATYNERIENNIMKMATPVLRDATPIASCSHQKLEGRCL